MNIDQLPDVALLRVMEFLPFIDQVRVGRVSQRFREFSQIVVSRTKSLNFGDKKLFELGFGKSNAIKPAQAIALLQLCSMNLESIEFGDGDLASQIFSTGFRFEHCTRLELKFTRSILSDDQLSRIISQHSNVLESLSNPLYESEQLNLDDGTICEKLRHLELGFTRWSEAFGSLTGRCPNLVSFKFYIQQIDTTIFNRFLESVPRLQSFEMLSHSYNLELENCSNFFRLPLTVLKLEHIESSPYDYINDEFIRKIVECFPDLEELALYLDCTNAVGASMLRHLDKLRELTLHTYDDCEEHLEVPIVSNSLESLDIRCHEVTVQALGNILMACPKLRRVVIYDIVDEIRREVHAVEMISYLGNLGLVDREITIVFCLKYRFFDMGDYQHHTYIWKSDTLMQALGELKTRNNFEIRIEEIDTKEYPQEMDDQDEDIDYTWAFRRMFYIEADEDEEDDEYLMASLIEEDEDEEDIDYAVAFRQMYQDGFDEDDDEDDDGETNSDETGDEDEFGEEDDDSEQEQ